VDLIRQFEKMGENERLHERRVNDLWFRFGQSVRMVREEHGISLRDMARRMGVSAPTLSDLELGRRHWTKARLEQFLALL